MSATFSSSANPVQSLYLMGSASPGGHPSFSKELHLKDSINAVRSIDVVTVVEDPPHWRSLATNALRGKRQEFRRLLEEFSVCLDSFFSRFLISRSVQIATDETLKSVARKFHTCDSRKPILPWLLAIARYRIETLLGVSIES